MTPADWSAFGELIKVLGLPIGLLISFVILLIRGVFVTGASADARLSALQSEMVYREALRIEERVARLAVEEQRDKAIQAQEQLTTLLHTLAMRQEGRITRGRT